MSTLPYTTLFVQHSILHKPDSTLCHVSPQKLCSKPQCSQNVSLSFQAYYSTTPTTMTQNSSVMLNCFSTVLNNEFSMCCTQCATMSECTWRPESRCRWSDTVSCVLQRWQALIVKTCCYLPLSTLMSSLLLAPMPPR